MTTHANLTVTGAAFRQSSSPHGANPSSSSASVSLLWKYTLVVSICLLIIGISGVRAEENANATSVVGTNSAVPPVVNPVHYRVHVLERKPFDPDNFVQGLEFHNNHLYVSSGLYGKSAIRRYTWPELALDTDKSLPDHLFAEGLTRLGERLLVLTWRARQLLILNRSSLELVGSVKLPGEGWGITHHGNTVYFSDGSHRLFHFNAAGEGSLAVIEVTLAGKPVNRLNELEWIDGEIWANVWQTDTIVRIDPVSGHVTGVINLAGLLPKSDYLPGTDVLNGIAQHPDTGDIWVTGKRWPALFRVSLEPVD